MNLRQQLTRWINYVSTQVQKPDATWLFSRLVYVWFILFAIKLWPDFDVIIGENALVRTQNSHSDLAHRIAYYLSYHPGQAKIFLWIHLAACVLSMWERISFFPRIIVYVTALMFYFTGHFALNAGYVLMVLFSCYLIIVNLRYRHPIFVSLANFGTWACMIQLCIVYLVAATYKWTGSMWLEGTAVHYTLQLEVFGTSFLSEWLQGMPVFLQIFTYLGIAYQTLFPVIVWFRGIKKYFLLIGIGFHLFIAVVLGLYFFSFAMVLGYVLFLKNDDVKKIRNYFAPKYVLSTKY